MLEKLGIVVKIVQKKKKETRLMKFREMSKLNVWGEVIQEAEYQGRKVELNNPTRGDVKKFKVYVKNDKGNVVKVEYGDPNMEIKRDDPARRKSFRARHNCDNPDLKYKARYWSCKFWEKGKTVTDLMKDKKMRYTPISELYRQVRERKLTPQEIEDREKIAKKLPMDDFKKRYGKDAMDACQDGNCN